MWEFTINGIKIRLPNLVGSVERLSKRNIYVLQGNRRQTRKNLVFLIDYKICRTF